MTAKIYAAAKERILQTQLKGRTPRVVPKAQRAFVLQPRSAEPWRVLSWVPCHPPSAPEHEPQRGSVTARSCATV